MGRYQGWVPMSDRDASAFLLDMSTATPFEPTIWFQLGIADTTSDELLGDLGLCVGGCRSDRDCGIVGISVGWRGFRPT